MRLLTAPIVETKKLRPKKIGPKIAPPNSPLSQGCRYARCSVLLRQRLMSALTTFLRYPELVPPEHPTGEDRRLIHTPISAVRGAPRLQAGAGRFRNDLAGSAAYEPSGIPRGGSFAAADPGASNGRLSAKGEKPDNEPGEVT